MQSHLQKLACGIRCKKYLKYNIKKKSDKNLTQILHLEFKIVSALLLQSTLECFFTKWIDEYVTRKLCEHETMNKITISRPLNVSICGTPGYTGALLEVTLSVLAKTVNTLVLVLGKHVKTHSVVGTPEELRTLNHSSLVRLPFPSLSALSKYLRTYLKHFHSHKWKAFRMKVEQS